MTTPTRLHRLQRWTAQEKTGGILLVSAAALALAWANSPWRESYAAVSQTVVGPAWLGLDLTIAAWAADGLLAVFFFTVGLELKHELVVGGLRDPRRAGVPVLAAVGGMVVPAAVFLALVTVTGDPGASSGWAIPTATDIAFALAVLAIFGRGLPPALRLFLLTLAVVDDLLAIIVIALFYTDGLRLGFLLGSLACVALFAGAVRSLSTRSLLLPVLGVVAWALMHHSGVHATIAGVLLGLSVPARPLRREAHARTEHFTEQLRPFTSLVALPAFALFSAGVVLADGAAELLAQPVVLAVGLGLLVGKVVGVLGVTAAVVRLTPLRLPPGIGLRDMLPVGLLTAIGFTVSLLITELSFDDDGRTSGAKAAVLGASLLAAVAAAVMLRWDARHPRHADMNEDGIPDAQQVDPALLDPGALDS